MWFWKSEQKDLPRRVDAGGTEFEILSDGQLSPQPSAPETLQHLRALPQHYEEREVAGVAEAPAAAAPSKRKK